MRHERFRAPSPPGAPVPSDGTRSGPSGAFAGASAGASAGTPTCRRGGPGRPLWRWIRSPSRWSARGLSRSCVNRDRRLPSDTSETGKWPLTGCSYPSSCSLASDADPEGDGGCVHRPPRTITRDNPGRQPMARVKTHPGSSHAAAELDARDMSANQLALAIRARQPDNRDSAWRAGGHGRNGGPSRRYLGTGPAFWMNLQSGYEISVVESAKGRIVEDEESWTPGAGEGPAAGRGLPRGAGDRRGGGLCS